MNMTKDYLPDTSIDIFQYDDMFRMNTDTALLGNFMKVNEDDYVLDIGTNNGALLLYASRYTFNLYGVDMLDEAIKLAKYNFNYHNLDDSNLYVSKIQDIVFDIKFDCIVCNPPYFKNHSPQRGKNYFKSVARHEMYLDLNELCASVNINLKEMGRFYMVHRAERIPDICITLNKYGLTIKNMQFMYDESKECAITVLIEAFKHSNEGCKVLQPIFRTRNK